MWLGSSVDGALHRYRKVMGLNPIQARIFFFGLLFQLLKLKAQCDDHKFYSCLSAVHIYMIFICIHIVARENEVRERIPHTCPSSYENVFQSIFVSASCGVAILMSTCYWSVRVTSFNFKLCGGLSEKSSERRLFKKSRSFSRVLIANEPRYISKLEK